MKQWLQELLSSTCAEENITNDLDSILEWIMSLNQNTTVNIQSIPLTESGFWFFDQESGRIINRNKSFFAISGMCSRNACGETIEQPIILQDEIGYLGILGKVVDGVLYFLMQAKIEPGNINKVQISPTIQATKSNFTQKHGGRQPAYLSYFENASKHTILVDQIQSEQSSRFYKKRNRNIIILVDEEVEVSPNHRWMTLGQIKELMKYDNLVNMDTRTVLSCLPFVLMDDERGGSRQFFYDQSLYNSMFDAIDSSSFTEIYNYINDYKMFEYAQPQLIRLDEMKGWEMSDMGITCRTPYSFSVIYCGIEVEGREVRRWTQPLFKAEGMATFGLYTTVHNGKRKFLIHAVAEVGCFDGIELGPTIQREAICNVQKNAVEQKFLQQYTARERILNDVILSEEGGRFYHEQNRNIILETDMFQPPEGYFWTDYRTLNLLTQVNNCLNIQLRNLLSLLEI